MSVLTWDLEGKFVLVEINSTSTNFAEYDFFPGPENRTKRGPPVFILPSEISKNYPQN